MTTKKSTTTRAKSTTAKPAKKAAPRSTPKAIAEKTATPVKVQEAEDTSLTVELQPVLRKKELFERVVTLSGAKKRDVKAIVEATLQVLGDSLAAGKSLALPPFGRAKVNRQKDLASGEMMMVRLRRTAENAEGGIAPANAALAETDQ